MKTLLLATAFAAALLAPAQAQSVGSQCRAQGQALGYATGNRYLGQRYETSCMVTTPLPPPPTTPELERLKQKMLEEHYEKVTGQPAK